MKFINLDDKVSTYEKAGFVENDHVIALLPNGEVKHGKLIFITEYQSLFEVQLLLENCYYKTVDLSGASVCKIEVIK